MYSSPGWHRIELRTDGRNGIPLSSGDLRPPHPFGIKQEIRLQKEESTLAIAWNNFAQGHYQDVVLQLRKYLFSGSDDLSEDLDRLSVLLLLARAYQYQGRYDLSEQTLLQAQQRAQKA